jgi:hypothetical protein
LTVGGPPATGYQGPMAKDEEFRKGDQVSWKSHGGTAEGEVEKKITEDTEAAGRTVRASKDEPQYLVRSEKSGGEAVHKPSALHKD